MDTNKNGTLNITEIKEGIEKMIKYYLKLISEKIMNINQSF